MGSTHDPRKEGQVVIVYLTNNAFKLASFKAYEGAHGLYVAAGDLDGDGQGEIIIGPEFNPHGKEKIKIFKKDGPLINEFQPYPEDGKFGISVTFGQVGK